MFASSDTEDQYLSSIFEINLKDAKSSNYPTSFSEAYTKLYGNAPEALSKRILEPVLHSVLTKNRSDGIEYVFDCYTRSARPVAKEGLMSVAKYSQTLLLRYLSLSLREDSPLKKPTTSRTSRQNKNGISPNSFLLWLGDASLDSDQIESRDRFLAALFEELLLLPHGRDTLRCIFQALHKLMHNVSLHDVRSIKGAFSALRALSANQIVREQLLHVPHFLPPHFDGYRIEHESALGKLIRISSIPDNLLRDSTDLFKGPTKMSEKQVIEAKQTIADALEASVSGLFDLWKRLLNDTLPSTSSSSSKANSSSAAAAGSRNSALSRSSSSSSTSPPPITPSTSTTSSRVSVHNLGRSALLSWVGCTLLGNVHRRNLRIRNKSTSSDAFMVTMAEVMLRVLDMLYEEDHMTDDESTYTPLSALKSLNISPKSSLMTDAMDIGDQQNDDRDRDHEQSATDDHEASSANGADHRSTASRYSALATTASGPFGDHLEMKSNALSGSYSEPGEAPLDVEPFFTLLPSRWNFSSETRLLAKSEERKKWQEEQRDEYLRWVSKDPHFESDSKWFLKSTQRVHEGIICDKCRSRALKDVRYKCANCRDFDLCESCEEDEFAGSLGLGRQKGVTFDCPYKIGRMSSQCPKGVSTNLTEVELRDHVREHHANDRITTVTCPICVSNKTHIIRAANPQFLKHLTNDHCDEHDPNTHVFIKFRRMVPHSAKYFEPSKESFVQPKMPTDAKVQSVADHEALTHHEGLECSNCGVTPLVGIAYVCYNCPDERHSAHYALCSKCEDADDHGHDPSHVFFKFRRVLKSDLKTLLPAGRKSLYPRTMIGSFGMPLKTEWFFMTLECLHLGVCRSFSRYSALTAQLSDAEERRSDIDYEEYLKIKMCIDAQILREDFITRIVALYSRLARWLLKFVAPSDFGVSTSVSMEFASLPEFMLQDLADVMIFLARFKTDALSIENSRHVVHLFTLLVYHRQFLTNPYLRSKLVEALVLLSPFKTTHSDGTHLGQVFLHDKVVIRALLPGLVNLYVDIESTGSDAQFYDKFSVRFEVAMLASHLLKVDDHVRSAGTLEIDLLLKFVSCVINDVIYLTDEAFVRAKAYTEARDLAKRIRTPENKMSRDAARRQLRTVALFDSLTIMLLCTMARVKELKHVFLRPELISRVAHLANYYVFKLCGPERATGQIEDAERLRFDSVRWLSQFTSIYLEFADSDDFMKSVVDDGRSFKPDVLSQSVAILREKFDAGDHPDYFVSRDELTNLEKFFADVVALHRNMESEEDDLGEVPENYLDPILQTIMTDPVKLPQSGMVVDRAVILRHLLSEATDPFSRTKLAVDELQPQTELRKEIEEFVKSKRNAGDTTSP